MVFPTPSQRSLRARTSPTLVYREQYIIVTLNLSKSPGADDKLLQSAEDERNADWRARAAADNGPASANDKESPITFDRALIGWDKRPKVAGLRGLLSVGRSRPYRTRRPSTICS